ncbi:MAG TPA: hypothetical protein VGO56_08100 [Pyrinomonadaceae bacterium]|jgi:hypothetical protein|nr:hypothetical protein [Pyrinomonadaceae bacterium]
MRSKFSGAFMLLGLLLLLFASTQTLFANSSPRALALKAVSENSAEAAPAIAELRALGPAGLDELFRTYAREIDQQVTHPLLAATPDWKRLSAALDEVSQQKDSYLSGLYWYTDFAQANAAARAANKPILSLRLLGKLNEEFSCANSRFFRTILYSNAEVSKMLREKFILYWESERPAPRVTIDFGDGRKLERTLTGNSIHYILDSDGKVIDALPGLYGPAAFMRLLNQMEAVFREPVNSPLNSPMNSKDRLVVQAVPYDRARLNAANVAWYADIQKTGGKIPSGLIMVEQNSEGQPTAISAAPYAMTKVFSEANMLKAIIGAPVVLGTVTDQATWNKIAQLHIADAKLDERSLGLIQRQTQGALSSDGSDKNKLKAFAALTERLQQNIALDTVRNEYLLHTKLYGWLMIDNDFRDVKKLDAKVYSDLFLTPASDPWLGLFSPEVYTALQGGGIIRGSGAN